MFTLSRSLWRLHEDSECVYVLLSFRFFEESLWFERPDGINKFLVPGIGQSGEMENGPIIHCLDDWSGQSRRDCWICGRSFNEIKLDEKAETREKGSDFPAVITLLIECFHLPSTEMILSTSSDQCLCGLSAPSNSLTELCDTFFSVHYSVFFESRMTKPCLKAKWTTSFI